MTRKTTKDIASILLQMPDPGKYQKIIDRAANNGYHDFKFDTIPDHPEYFEDCVCPKMKLVEDLNEFPELSHIRKDVIDGVYDESPDEDDNERSRAELMDDGAGDAVFEVLGLKVPTDIERMFYKKKV